MASITQASLATIGALSVRWPDHQTLQWTALRQVIADAREAVATVGEAVDAANGDCDLSDQGRARRITSAALSAIAKLDALPSLARAERLVADFLEGQSQRRPTPIKPPSTVNDVQVAAEIRQWISRQKSPLQGAMSYSADPVVASAILTAPGFLSGLTAEQTNLVRQAAETAINPEAVAIRKENQDAIEEARRAVVQARERIGKLANLRRTGAGTFEPSTIAA